MYEEKYKTDELEEPNKCFMDRKMQHCQDIDSLQLDL